MLPETITVIEAREPGGPEVLVPATRTTTPSPSGLAERSTPSPGAGWARVHCRSVVASLARGAPSRTTVAIR